MPITVISNSFKQLSANTQIPLKGQAPNFYQLLDTTALTKMSCHSYESHDLGDNRSLESFPISIPSTSNPANTTTAVVENAFLPLEHTFRALTVLFKTYKDELYSATEKYRNRHSSTISSRTTSATRKALASIHALLTSNINQIRLNSSPIELITVGARLAAIKEGFVYVEARLDDIETFKHGLEVMLIRLTWREARHKMLSKIYTDASTAEAYETLDIHHLTTGLVQLPKIYGRDTITETQDWPEQLRDIESGATCPICKLDLREDPDENTEYTFGIVPSACCEQPFHSACLSSHLKAQNGRATSPCPLCRASWGAEEAVGMIAVRVVQMEDAEKGWKRRANL